MFRKILLVALTLVEAGGMLAGCATGPQPTAAPVPVSIPQALLEEAPPPPFPKVTVDWPMGPFEEFVRHVGQEVGGGMVLMNGMGQYLIPAQHHKEVSYENFMRTLSEAIGCVYVKGPYYYFLYPSRYQSESLAALAAFSLIGKLDPIYDHERLACTFGENTLFFNALNTIGATLGKTLVADNIVAETRCGELFLPECPVPVALTALCQSARLQQSQLEVESTQDYIFFRSITNQTQATTRLDAVEAEDPYAAFLNERIDLYLPEPPKAEGKAGYYYEARPLGKMLKTLSNQIGAPVRLGNERMRRLPVNPCVMKQLPRSTALDLLIRQWPAPRFGYRIDADGVLLCTR